MNQFGYALEIEESICNEELWGKWSLVYCLAMDVVDDSEQGEVHSECSLIPGYHLFVMVNSAHFNADCYTLYKLPRF
jgi:hypothetical protein